MSTHERRASPRLASANLAEVVVSDGSGAQAVCRIQDISPFGLRLEFVEPGDAARFAACRALTVVRCEEAIAAMLQGRACEVRWRDGATLGARFEPSLGVSLAELGMSAEFVRL